MINNALDGSGNRLKEFRKYLGMNQMQFAELINSSNGHVSDMEKDRKNITETTIELLKLKKNINEAWLRTGNGKMRDEVPVEDEYFKAATQISKNKDEFAMQAIIEYWKLDEDSKKVFRDYIYNVAEKSRG